jgi:hypothetical protein
LLELLQEPVSTAGGNDLNHALRALPDRPVVDQNSAAVRASANLEAMARRLRELNPTAPVRFIGLYNPFDVAPSEEADAPPATSSSLANP